MVIFLSLSEESVLVAMIAGTEHPKPISIGTKLRPDKPIFRRSLSITNETLAIYPLSSSMDRKKKSTTIIGRKDNTLPTPVNTPSIINDWTIGLRPYAVKALSTTAVSFSIPRDSRSERIMSGAQSILMDMDPRV